MGRINQLLGWIKSNALILILAIAAASQLAFILTGAIPKPTQAIWRERNASAPWRSASILFGDEYIEFVKAIVPEDGLVIIPKEEQVWNFGNVGLMQYFLFPRQIADCPIADLEECILSLKGSNSYVLAPDLTFPPREYADQVKRYIPFKGDRGLYVPLQ
jgi:hypothetical protein